MTPPDGGISNKILVEVKGLKMYFPVTEGIIISRTVAEVKAAIEGHVLAEAELSGTYTLNAALR